MGIPHLCSLSFTLATGERRQTPKLNPPHLLLPSSLFVLDNTVYILIHRRLDVYPVGQAQHLKSFCQRSSPSVSPYQP